MAEKKKLDLSFLRPSFTVIELPSRGKFYTGIPELESGVLHVRPFSSVEEKMIDRFNQNTFYDMVDEIIKNCVKEDIDIDDLTLGDRIFILLNIRVLSYGSTYEVRFECGKCDSEYPLIVDLSQFEPTYLDVDEVVEPMELELPVCKATVKMRMVRSGDLRESTNRSYAERKRNGVFVDASVYQKALCCEEFILPESSADAGTVLHSANPDEFRYILGIMNRLNSNDSRAIEDLFVDYQHGFIDPISMTCKVCGASFDQYVSLNWDFFRPRTKRRKDTEFLEIDDDVSNWESGGTHRKRAVRSGKGGELQLVRDSDSDVHAEETAN